MPHQATDVANTWQGGEYQPTPVWLSNDASQLQVYDYTYTGKTRPLAQLHLMVAFLRIYLAGNDYLGESGDLVQLDRPLVSKGTGLATYMKMFLATDAGYATPSRAIKKYQIEQSEEGSRYRSC